MSTSKTPEQRFLAKVDKSGPGGCWLWTASTVAGGYAQFKVEPKTWKAHRWAYEFYVGPIPEGLQLDHLCRVRHCVNPGHLEPVSAAVNLRRADEALGIRSSATRCSRGHEFTPDNTHYYTPIRSQRRKTVKPIRMCAICKRAANRATAVRKVAS